MAPPVSLRLRATTSVAADFHNAASRLSIGLTRRMAALPEGIAVGAVELHVDAAVDRQVDARPLIPQPGGRDVGLGRSAEAGRGDAGETVEGERAVRRARRGVLPEGDIGLAGAEDGRIDAASRRLQVARSPRPRPWSGSRGLTGRRAARRRNGGPIPASSPPGPRTGDRAARPRPPRRTEPESRPCCAGCHTPRRVGWCRRAQRRFRRRRHRPAGRSRTSGRSDRAARRRPPPPGIIEGT